MVPDCNRQCAPIGHRIPRVDRCIQDGSFKFGGIDFYPRFPPGGPDLNLNMATERASQDLFQCVDLDVEIDDLRPNDTPPAEGQKVTVLIATEM